VEKFPKQPTSESYTRTLCLAISPRLSSLYLCDTLGSSNPSSFLINYHSPLLLRQDVSSRRCWSREGVWPGSCSRLWYVLLIVETPDYDISCIAIAALIPEIVLTSLTGSAGIAELAVFHPVRNPTSAMSTINCRDNTSRRFANPSIRSIRLRSD
jgi:hypothetical protein